MPTYQYRCQDCGNDLEVKQSFTDASLTECPDCRGTLRKVFGAAGVVFKGSGFYRNDARAADSAEASARSASESTPAKASPDSAPAKANSTGE